MQRPSKTHIAVDLDWNETGDDEAVIEPVIQALSEEEIEKIFHLKKLLVKNCSLLIPKHMGKDLKTSFSSNYISPDYLPYWRCAVVESFFGLLKRQCVNRVRFLTRDEARATVFEYIEVFYNRKRRHGYLEHVSPVDFENRTRRLN